MSLISPELVATAQKRIAPFIHKTPLVTSTLLNGWLGSEVYFKCENLQKAGAFKIRGALNVGLKLKEQNKLPKHFVAFSSGNHAQAVALTGRMLGVRTTVVLPGYTTEVKKQATRAYGAEVIETRTRQETEIIALELKEKGAYLIPPFDSDDVIEGQGTAAFEALEQLKDSADISPDAIFAACGGGGLLSGTYLAKELLSPNTQIYGTEPKICNDAGISFRTGKIFRFAETQMSIAEGARTLAVGERTFEHLKKLNGFFEVEESDIIYWTQWLMHLLKLTIEPTSAVAMGGAVQWLAAQPRGQKIIVMLSGGNLGADTYRKLWENDRLGEMPTLPVPEIFHHYINHLNIK